MKAVVALFVLLALAASCNATITYLADGEVKTLPSAQLWYEGLWVKVPWLNGSLTWHLNNNTRGKIFISTNFGPHEPQLRVAQRFGAIGAVYIRPGNFPPGFSMYIVDASDRSDIVIPVVEVVYPRSYALNKLPEGTLVSIQPGHNRHKDAQDSPFQLIMNLIQSFWELAIICLGLYRVYQFYGVEGLTFLSVAPICCLLEVVAACLRLAYTCVDPFFTYRMISNSVSLVLITLSIPFSEAAGILITFFWAESLTKHNVRAVPFISHYKWPAAAAICALFFIEILCDALRASTSKTGNWSIYISLVLYTIVAIVLVVCYITTAVLIMRKISQLGVKSGKDIIKSLTYRMVTSSAGYIIVIAALISYAIFSQLILGRGITLNLVFIGFNLAGISQVYSLRPINRAKSSTSGGSKPSSGIDSETTGEFTGVKSPRPQSLKVALKPQEAV